MKAQQLGARRRTPVRTLGKVLLRTAVFVVFLVVVGVAAAGGIALTTYERYAAQYVEPTELSLNQPSAGAVILDRNGEVLYQFIDDEEGIRKPVKLEDVSPYLIAATIATEDASFFHNPGVNFKGLMRAGQESFDSLVESGDPFTGTGGSSITQQFVKNAYIPREDRSEKSIDRKMRELVFALEVTKETSKEQILEWYLNEISYGGIYSGVEAASQGYFGKSSKDLTLGEAALLAGIPQSPSAYDPRVNLEAALARRNDVLGLMARWPSIEIGYGQAFPVNPEELVAAGQEGVTLSSPQFPIQAPHFVLTYVVPQLEQMFGREALMRDGLVITTTLDLGLQDRSLTILNHWVNEFERISNTHNGATTVIEPNTGEILVMLGSRDYFRDDIAGQINNLLAPNSPGSTFKPFVYLTTFVEKGWTPETIIQDSPVSFREANGTFFSPTNPGGGYSGPISIRNALGNSLNIPAFKAALDVGVGPIVKMAKRMGFTDLKDSYGPSIALGGVDFKALDLAYGYGVIANRGVMAGQDTFAPTAADEKTVSPIAILKVEDQQGNVRFNVDEHRVQQQIVPTHQADLVADILSDPSARCRTFGCGGLAVPGYKVGVKTGTSEPYDPAGPNRGKIGETWAFGFTPDLIVGVWAGNSNNAPIDNIFSTSISYRAMRDILLEAYKGRQATPFSFTIPPR